MTKICALQRHFKFCKCKKNNCAKDNLPLHLLGICIYYRYFKRHLFRNERGLSDSLFKVDIPELV